jgi:hypothetical protein
MDLQAQQVLLEPLALQVLKAMWAQQDPLVLKEMSALQDLPAFKVFKVFKVTSEPQAPRERKAMLVTLAPQALQV